MLCVAVAACWAVAMIAAVPIVMVFVAMSTEAMVAAHFFGAAMQYSLQGFALVVA